MYSRPCQCATPRCEPIVMPVQERVCNRYHTIEQPIICPVNTRIVHHYIPKPVYYPTYTQTEEVNSGCAGQGVLFNQTPTGTATPNTYMR